MASNKKFLNTLRNSGKGMVRNFLITLKKNPNMIPFAMLIISFLVYSLNLTYISNTTATIQGQGTGLCEFVSMLFSILSMLAMLNAFPKRKKPNYLMVGLLLGMFLVIIGTDIVYSTKITNTINKLGSSIKAKQLQEYLHTYGVIIAHIVLVAITGVITVLEPVFAKLLKKIKTTVEIEETNIASIDIVDEE